MNRWTTVNLLLAGAAAVLLALDLWPDRPGDRATLTPLTADEIRSVRVERAGRLELAFEHDRGDWQLTHPVQAPAEPRRVGQLLAIARAPVEHRFTASSDLAAYGLDPPKAVVQFNQNRLSFGERDPSQHGRYVLADGRIQVIDDVYFNLVTLPAGHFTRD